MIGRPPIEENPTYKILVEELAQVREEKAFLRKKYERELGELNHKYKDAILAACRRAVNDGLSAYGVGKATGITNGDRRRAFMAEVLRVEEESLVSQDWFDANWAEVESWKLRRKSQSQVDRDEPDWKKRKIARVTEAVDPSGGKWLFETYWWGGNSDFNYVTAPGGERFMATKPQADVIPWQVRAVANKEEWLAAVEK